MLTHDASKSSLQNGRMHHRTRPATMGNYNVQSGQAEHLSLRNRSELSFLQMLSKLFLFCYFFNHFNLQHIQKTRPQS